MTNIFNRVIDRISARYDYAVKIFEIIKILKVKNALGSMRLTYVDKYLGHFERLLDCTNAFEILDCYKHSDLGVLNKTLLSDFSSKAFNAILFETVILPILNKHIDLMASKSRTLIYKDEFGDFNYKRWKAELMKYYKSKLESEIICFFSEEIRLCNYLLDSFESSTYHHVMTELEGDIEIIMMIDSHIGFFIENPANIKGVSAHGKISRHDYEHIIANRINCETNWSADVTNGYGHQGCDILIYGPRNKNAVVQFKNYSSKVGNKAVQEVSAAKLYYGVDYAFVVTNNFFTNSAKELADKCGVLFFQEEDLISFLQKN